MIREFCLPDLGEGLTESEILSWRVSEGDTVTLNQVIAEVETAKAIVELPSPYAGVVARLHEQPGTVVEVGAPIVSFDIPAADGADAGPGTPAEPPASRPDAGGEGVPAPTREPTLVGYGAPPDSTGRPARRARTGLQVQALSDGHAPAAGALAAPPPTAPAEPAAAVPAVAAARTVPAVPAGGTGGPRADGAVAGPAGGTRRRSTPPVRKLARDLGVDLEQVTGSGPDGLVQRPDVLAAAGNGAAADAPAAAPAAPVAAPGGAAPAVLPVSGMDADPRQERIPIAGVRRMTAAAMVASAFTAPHATVFLTVDVTATMDLLRRLRTRPAYEGIRLSPLTMAAKAACVLLGRHPDLNSRWDEQGREIIRYRYVNLGIAAATERGLLVPNIKDAQALDLHGLAAAINELTATARAGRSQPSALTGGTFSISNVGSFGVDAGTPILNPGEAAILALGAVRRIPWEHEGAIALREVMTLSLSFDHRLVDGEQGSRFLADLGDVLGEPALALAF